MDGQCILITHTVGWTDSTDLVNIYSHEKGRFDYSGLMFVEYQGLPVYYEYGILKGYNNFVSDFSRFDEALPNKLKWSKAVFTENLNSAEEDIGNPEEFNRIIISYYPSLKCIEEVLLDRNGFEQKIRAVSDKYPNFCSR
jgi:hypothetical protein